MFPCALAYPPAYFCACAGPNRHDVSIDMGDFGRIDLYPASVPFGVFKLPEAPYPSGSPYR